ncbi:MAG: hypothetical protein IPG08_01050 [Sphingobacteriaceae bacterium]|nr:hypothetical protein [Sphingobacteriaceae bacterium]
MDVLDALIAPFYLMLVLFLAYKYKAKHQHKHEAYQYFIPGLLAKIIGAICLGLVYYYYYGGGDTINYFNTASAFVDLCSSNKSEFMHIYFGDPFYSEYYLVKGDANFIYWVNDPYAFFVSKCFFPIVLLGAKSYMASAIIVAALCYISVWQLYMLFVNEFPTLFKEFAFSILFVPSVTFWGSGIMKDSLSFRRLVCMFMDFIGSLSINAILFQRFFYFLSAFLLIFVKPYILFALLPGSIVWFVALKVVNIKNGLVKILLAPAIIIVGD